MPAAEQDAGQTTTLYSETLVLSRSWLAWAVTISSILVLAANVFAIYLQVRASSFPWSRSPLLEPVTIWSFAMVVLALILLWLSRTLRLKVELTGTELRVELEPLFRRTLGPGQIVRWETIQRDQSDPQYLGSTSSAGLPWGWATGIKGSAVVCLFLARGKPLLVGVTRPEDFTSALGMWKELSKPQETNIP